MKISALVFLLLSSSAFGQMVERPQEAERLTGQRNAIPRPADVARISGYQVIGIADGDTLTVLQDRKPVKLRLANIDAPEKSQPFGQRSKESLSDLCWGKGATYETQDIDRYGRTVAVVTCGGVEVNRAQVERGMAWVYPRYNKDQSLPALQEKSRNAGVGLWRDSDPIPPWEYRRSSKLSREN